MVQLKGQKSDVRRYKRETLYFGIYSTQQFLDEKHHIALVLLKNQNRNLSAI